jgi:Domain of unknown function (DUF4342)
MQPDDRPWSERVDEAGRDAADRAREIINRGNARRVLLRDPKGAVLVQLPLTAAVVVALLLVVSAPWLAVIGAAITLIAGCSLQVMRLEPPQIPEDT